MNYFATTNLHISLAAEKVFSIGSFTVTNSLVLGSIGVLVMLGVLFYVARQVRKGSYNRFVGTVQLIFETLLQQCDDVMGDKVLARKIAPLAITIFFTVLFTYWIGILPGVGSITVGEEHTPLFRALPADLNFTFAIAIITIVASQLYAIKYHGFFGNIGRYVKNPLKDPIAAFEGILEFIGEFSRLVALSFRLFGNTFAGEVLLMVVAILAGYFASLALPFVMVFELFIGFIQAYVFFMLTLIFTSLAVATHGGGHEKLRTTSSRHSSAHASKMHPQTE